MDFSDLSFPDVEKQSQISFRFDITNVSISDKEGQLLFYTNGADIEDASFETMENGDGLSEDSSTGNIEVQGTICLPMPADDRRYMLIHEEQDAITGLSIVVLESQYSIIDMDENDGLGAVTLKKQTILSDTLCSGKVQAVKHANGRDWWVLKRREFSSKYYTMLLNPEGLSVVDTQIVGDSLRTGLGQATFSPDGIFYAQYHTVSTQVGQFIDIYSFDRCSGQLTQLERIHYNDGAGSGGVAISPNSRFLYAASGEYIYQYDLWANNIEASQETVAVYDGFIDPFPTRFFQCQLAPDGKIYISASNSVKYLHVIHYPDRQGTDCGVEQHGIALPSFNLFSMPNYPNYRLGPLDGSVCDTLGLDNVPVAQYRYDQDSIDYLEVQFTDLSYYEPTTWQWNFGGTGTSQESKPVHLFPGAGTYEVCLTVSNENGEDTFCRMLELEVPSTTEELEKELEVLVYPNPAREVVEIIFQDDYFSNDGVVRFYNAMGQLVRIRSLCMNKNSLSLEGLSPGLYFYEVKNGEGRKRNGKLVVK